MQSRRNATTKTRRHEEPLGQQSNSLRAFVPSCLRGCVLLDRIGTTVKRIGARSSIMSMKASLAVVIVGIGLVVAATPLVAHHSFAAEFDANKAVTLKGLVTRIEWTNPHAHFFIDVKDDQGTTTNWKFELASPNVLVQQCGWTGKTLHVGDEVTVEGAMAKDGSTMANARGVTLADGRRVSAGSSGGDLPPR